MTSPFAHWSRPPNRIILKDKQVHVWCACLKLPMSQVRILNEMLDDDELKRALRYKFVKDYKRFIVSRGLLKIILSRYIHIDPGQICLRYNSFGKPMLNERIGRNYIHFNLSRTDDLALFAITKDRKIGVDVESINLDIEIEGIVERFFSSDEVTALRSLPVELRHKAFFQCWTCKEAFIKAKGKGLTIPLDSFSISLNPEKSPDLVCSKFCADEASRWSLYTFDLGINYCAGLAVEGHNFQIKSWLFSTRSW